MHSGQESFPLDDISDSPVCRWVTNVIKRETLSDIVPFSVASCVMSAYLTLIFEILLISALQLYIIVCK